MFDLEQAITEWRHKMANDGVKDPAVLDELESHLRDELEGQRRAGLDPQQALTAAIERMGPPRKLRREFARAGGFSLARCFGLAYFTLGGFFSFMVGGHLFHVEGVTLKERVLGLTAAALTFLIMFSWRHSHRWLPAISNVPARMIVAALCCVSGAVWLALFLNLIMPRLVLTAGSADDPLGRLVVGLLWAMTITTALGSLAYGLEEAARRRLAQ